MLRSTILGHSDLHWRESLRYFVFEKTKKDPETGKLNLGEKTGGLVVLKSDIDGKFWTEIEIEQDFL